MGFLNRLFFFRNCLFYTWAYKTTLFEVLTAVKKSMIFICFVTPCGLVCMSVPTSALQMEAVYSCKTLVSTWQSTWRYNPEDQHRPSLCLFYRRLHKPIHNVYSSLRTADSLLWSRWYLFWYRNYCRLYRALHFIVLLKWNCLWSLFLKLTCS